MDTTNKAMQKILSDTKVAICNKIRAEFSDSWGKKDDNFIEETCSLYSAIYEAVCNKGIEIEKLTQKSILALVF